MHKLYTAITTEYTQTCQIKDTIFARESGNVLIAYCNKPIIAERLTLVVLMRTWQFYNRLYCLYITPRPCQV